MELEILPASRFSELAGVADGLVPDPRVTVAIVLKDGDEIVGRVFLMQPVHIEGTWVAEKRRGTIAAARLIHEAERQAKILGVKKLMAYTTNPDHSRYIAGLGYGKLDFEVFAKEI